MVINDMNLKDQGQMRGLSSVSMVRYEFVSKISGQEFERLSERGFVRCSDKIHWRFELPGYHRALMTQIRDVNGWCVVFVGNHREYDAYCKAKGVRIK